MQIGTFASSKLVPAGGEPHELWSIQNYKEHFAFELLLSLVSSNLLTPKSHSRKSKCFPFLSSALFLGSEGSILEGICFLKTVAQSEMYGSIIQ
jgi:hypothetical protein